jgi:hypothetical protein
LATASLANNQEGITMKLHLNIAIALATLASTALVVPAAGAAGEPKNELPFTRQIGVAAGLVQSYRAVSSTATPVSGGERKNEWPFIRPTSPNRGLATIQHVSGNARGCASRVSSGNSGHRREPIAPQGFRALQTAVGTDGADMTQRVWTSCGVSSGTKTDATPANHFQVLRDAA